MIVYEKYLCDLDLSQEFEGGLHGAYQTKIDRLAARHTFGGSPKRGEVVQVTWQYV
jgi:hypothetical protein